MKKTLFILLLIPCLLQAQNGISGLRMQSTAFQDNAITGTFTPYDSVVYLSDTTLLFKGIDTVEHVHNYLRKEFYSDATANFFRYDSLSVICFICLRNFGIKCTTKIVKKRDPYNEAMERLSAIKKNL